MKTTAKETGSFIFGMIVAGGVLGIIFFGCSRINDSVQGDDMTNDVIATPTREVLHIGAEGMDVLYLHQQLYNLFPNTVPKDLLSEDFFGETTQFYVMLFQLAQDMEPHGVVDEQTWIALDNPMVISDEKINELKAIIPIDGDEMNISGENTDLSDNATSKGKVAYLTFDDGPNPTYTPQIVEILQKYNAGATFFVLGQEVDKYAHIASDTSKNGHSVANHTDTHLDISTASDEMIKEEIQKTNALIKKATGKTPICFRPPYGAIKSDTNQKLQNAGGKTIMWDVDTQDWARPGVDEIVNHVLMYTQDGEIILMHDGGGDRTQTIAALEKILKKMTQEGWKFKALDCAK